ncbi:DNA repair protein Rad52/59/22, partial [Microdochium trichocladiopsis]
QLARMEGLLRRPLGPEFVSTRVGNGVPQVSYLSSGDAVLLMNFIFGAFGWKSELMSEKLEVKPAQGGGKIDCDVQVVVRVTAFRPGPKEDPFHDGSGSGRGRGVNLSDALESARKEASTDAKKRAIMNFGWATGGCMYDKAFTQ